MRKLLALFALAAVAGSVPAASQQASAPTVTGETGLFTLFNGQTLPQGQWSFGLYYNNWDRLVAPVPGGVEAPLSDNWGFDWNRLSASVGYGISDHFEISLAVPYDKLKGSANRRLGFVNGHFFEREIDGSGIGDLRVGGKWRLFGGPEAEHSFALNAFVELPTGKDEEGIVTGDPGFGLGADWSVKHWVFSLGYHDPGDADHFDVAEEILAGVGYEARINERFDWITELAATLYTGGDSASDDQFDLTTGGRYWVGTDGHWAVNFALRTELGQVGNSQANCPLGGLVGLSYFPRFKNREQALAEREAAERAAAEAARKAAEEAAARKAAEEAAARKAAEEAAQKKAAEDAARQAAEEAARRAAEEAAKPKEVRETVNFTPGSARLSNIAKAKLDEVALRLKQDPSASALILGYADSQGNAAGNQRLSERRAQAARDYLVQRHQIDAARIQAEGKGSAEPVADNAAESGRQENRRAVIIVQIHG
ncbi:MAG: OmpA family protein [Thermoanaerobaculia bacterium]